MKNLKYILLLFLTLAGFSACIDDETNTNYLSDYDAGVIVFDTTGIANRLVLQTPMSPGDHIEFEPKVDYCHPERLRYRWFCLSMRNGVYSPEQVGNSMVYPPADTIATTLKLDWIVDLDPGTYSFYLMAEDTVTGMKGFYKAQETFVQVITKGVQGGLYLLTENGENTDIEVLASPLMMIAGDKQCKKFYSEMTGSTLSGKPKFIHGSHTGGNDKDGFLICTDKNLYRIARQGMVIMDEWKNMFYDTPDVFNPQMSFFDNRTKCEVLINDDKMHVLYTNKGNDRKFSAPIAGDFEAYPYLMAQPRQTWQPAAGAINADQVIFDKKNKRFVPYYAYNSSISQFKTTNGDAFLDANKLPGVPVKILNGYTNSTYAIMLLNGTYYLYRYNFQQRPDNGDLSADGANSIINLSGCTNLAQAKYWATCSAYPAFYYATDKACYSFSYTTGGANTSNTIYECEANEEITCIYASGSANGGFPTAQSMMWIATWNSATKEGKIIEYEMDHNYGVPASNWGPMFGSLTNPTITTGWQKIVGMTFIEVE